MGKVPGDMIGRYVIDRRLAAGGMAEAYLAHQKGPAGFVKPVVVKVLHAQHAHDPKVVELFLNEARVGARLNHANIVQIFDLGKTDGGEHFIAMEYVDGLTLLQLATRSWALGTGLSIDAALRVAAATALGLHHAHTMKSDDGSPWSVIHRDIAPDNIMIARDGTVKILDFGVAKLRGTEATQAGEIKGKIPYMSPEQLEAGVELDGRADLWSLGVTLYWCLVGRRPFTAPNDVHVIRAILETKPERPSKLNKAITPALDELVMSLLEKDRDKRVPSAARLAQRLQRMVPPVQDNPLAKLIERMMVFDDDPPEDRGGAGGTSGIRGLPAVADDDAATDLIAAPPHTAPTGEAAPAPAPESAAAALAADVDRGARGPERNAAVPVLALGAVGVVGVLLVVLIAAQLWTTPDAAPDPAFVSVLADHDAELDSDATLTARDDTPAPAPRRPHGADIGDERGSRHRVPPAAAAAALRELGARADAAAAGDAGVVDVAGAPSSASAEAPAVADADKKAVEPPVVMRSVVVVAPKHIRWTTMSGKSLGSGSRTLQVPEGEKTILALDGANDGKITVAVASRIEWSAQPKAKLVLRALPYATDVKLGGQSLGSTPLAARSVVAGVAATYPVTFVKDKQVVRRVVHVKPGEDAIAAVTMK